MSGARLTDAAVLSIIARRPVDELEAAAVRARMTRTQRRALDNLRAELAPLMAMCTVVEFVTSFMLAGRDDALQDPFVRSGTL